MTEFRVSITDADDDVAELHELYASILDDAELRAARKSLVPGEQGSGRMGTEDFIRLFLDNPGLDTALSTCFAAWLANRTRRSRVKVIIRANGSAELVADKDNVVTAVAVAQALKTARDGRTDAAAD